MLVHTAKGSLMTIVLLALASQYYIQGYKEAYPGPHPMSIVQRESKHPGYHMIWVPKFSK